MRYNEASIDGMAKALSRFEDYTSYQEVKHVIKSMTTANDIEHRNRALVAFTLLTGAKDGAIASMKLKHVDLVTGGNHQDACEVKTKFGKTFSTTLFPVGEEVVEIVVDWVQ